MGQVGSAAALTLTAIAYFALLAGCAGPPPRMFPMSPVETRRLPDGTLDWLYDTNNDGRADYVEHVGSRGQVDALRYDNTGNGQFDEEIDLTKVPASECRQLVILLDSVPFGVVDDLWRSGRLRLYRPPVRTISPFPVMTDLSFAEFFSTSPCAGAESEYYDGRKLTSGYDTYADASNCTWHRYVDYHLNNVVHSIAYFGQYSWTDHELRETQDLFLQRSQGLTVGYSVGTSALGAFYGRSGHQYGLIHADRMCQWIMHKMKGRVRFVLMSDHGHNLVPSKLVPLPEMMQRFGYRVTNVLTKPGDVVIPEFGVVTYAGIYTREKESVARDAVGIEGIEQATFLDESDRVVVIARDGRATISHGAGGYRYDIEFGDPLRLQTIAADLARRNRVSPDGFITDSDWFEATKSHVYPDPLQRLWRAYHGLMEHPPDVMLTVQDGWQCGSKLMSSLVDVASAHGNLGLAGSCGFAITNAGDLPPVMRMTQLHEELRRLGFEFVAAAGQ